MNDLEKQKIIQTFRKALYEKGQSLYLEAAEMTGFLVADAEKHGFTRPQAVEMAKQHMLSLAEVWQDFAENHLEWACKSITPRLKQVEKEPQPSVILGNRSAKELEFTVSPTELECT